MNAQLKLRFCAKDRAGMRCSDDNAVKYIEKILDEHAKQCQLDWSLEVPEDLQEQLQVCGSKFHKREPTGGSLADACAFETHVPHSY